MKMRLIAFGVLDIEGHRYEDDLVIDHGEIRKRDKRASKAFRDRFGHTPLSAEEPLPWHGKTLYVGTGAQGALPIMPEVYQRAREHGIKVVARPTPELGKLFKTLKPKDINAVIHVTC